MISKSSFFNSLHYVLIFILYLPLHDESFVKLLSLNVSIIFLFTSQSENDVLSPS